MDSVNSIISSEQLAEEDVKVKASTTHKWTSNLKYTLLIVICCMTTDYYGLIKGYRDFEDANIFQYIVCIFFIGLPLQYMQIMLGRYTCRCSLFLSNMCPIIQGLGCVMTISMVLGSVPVVVHLGDLGLYLINCFQTNMPWLVCKPEYTSECWTKGLSECPNFPCVSKSIHISSHVYWNYTFMDRIDDVPRFRGVNFNRLVMSVITWVGLYLMLTLMDARLRQKVVKLMFISSFILLVVIALSMLVLCEGATKGFANFIRSDWNQLCNIRSWVKASVDVLLMLRLGTGIHILISSYFPTVAGSGIMAGFSCLLITLSVALCTITFHFSLGCIAKATNIRRDRTTIINSKYELVQLSIIPQAFNFMGGSHLWTLIHFLSNIIVNINLSVMNVRTVETAFGDAHIQFISRYHTYIMSLYVLVGMIFSAIFVMKGIFIYTNVYYKKVLEAFDIINLFIFSLSTSWIYGVQQICDDIHFITGFQPTNYWKWCWYIIPAIMGVITYHVLYSLNETSASISTFFFLMLLEMPLIVMSMIQVFQNIMQKNLVGLFRPKEEWGPRDINERKLRQLYNPRHEIRARRREDNCQHRCLIRSTFLHKLVAEEEKVRSALNEAPNDNRYSTEDSDSLITLF